MKSILYGVTYFPNFFLINTTFLILYFFNKYYIYFDN